MTTCQFGVNGYTTPHTCQSSAGSRRDLASVSEGSLVRGALLASSGFSYSENEEPSDALPNYSICFKVDSMVHILKWPTSVYLTALGLVFSHGLLTSISLGC